MIPVRSFGDRDVGVFGLARSGLSAIKALKAGGARIFAWDENEAARAEAAALGAKVAPFPAWPWIASGHWCSAPACLSPTQALTKW
jgi:UDP-N-acetylmuramoylalanine--D-glutamate ligase